jgi:Ca2+-binding RTX toxin-like protein
MKPGGLVVTDLANETNAMTVRAEPGQLIFDDTGAAFTVTASQCTAATPQEVRCASTGVTALTARLGGGNDSLRLDDSSSTLAAIAFASIDGEAGDDELVSGAGVQHLLGGVGDDGLDAGDGDDVLIGGDGNDMAFGGPGHDALGAAGSDLLIGGGGPDVAQGEAGDDELNGGVGDDDVSGGLGNDIVRGDDGNDRLEMDPADPARLNSGSDTVEGGAGIDIISGGSDAAAAEPDSFSGGDGFDTIDYRSRSSPLAVSLDGTANDGAAEERDNVQADIQRVLGGSAGDTLDGSDGPNFLYGGLGSDYLNGRRGRDTLRGDPGDDYIDGGPGPNSLYGGPGIDLLRARDGRRDRVVSCGEGVDLVIADRRDVVTGCESVDRGGRRRQVVAQPAEGSVKIRLPNATRFVPLPSAAEVPVGSTLDASRGTATVEAAKPRGGTAQKARFDGGVFTVRQRRSARPSTNIRLRGGHWAVCRAFGSGGTSARRVRQLRTRIAKRGGGKPKEGGFKVRGAHSNAAADGTTWVTEDRCDGTLTRVMTGTVRVRDFRRHRTVVVHAGHSYLARAR